MIRAGRHTMLCPLREIVPVRTQSWVGQSEELTRRPFPSSDCPTQDCVHTGTISRSGQSIVCLPARIVIQLTGGAADSSGVDIVIG